MRWGFTWLAIVALLLPGSARAVDQLLRERVVRPAVSNYTTLGRLDLPFVAVYADAFYWRGVLLTNGGGFGAPSWGFITNRFTTNVEPYQINAEYVTNAVGITAGNLITVTPSSSGRDFVVSAQPEVQAELASGAVTTPWTYPSKLLLETTNILINLSIPADGLYAVNIAAHTVTTNDALPIDSSSYTFIQWTAPSGQSYTSDFIDTKYESGVALGGSWYNRLSRFAPMLVDCKAGSALVVSNYNADSWETGDGASTNYLRVTVTGRKQ